MLPDDLKCTICESKPKLDRAKDTDYIIHCCGVYIKNPIMPKAVRMWKYIDFKKRK